MKRSDVAARLGVRHPIVQGPFGGGLSTARLAAAVSRRGGLGSFGAHVLPPDRIGPLVREIAGLTSEPFAVNLWISNADPGGLDFDRGAWEEALARIAPYFAELGAPLPPMPASAEVGPRYEEQIEALLEARPPVFSFVFGIPSAAILEACRARGIVTVGAATSIREAQALEAAGVDVIVASGSEAGGHRPSFLDPAEDVLMGTFALTQLVSARVSRSVIAAGGIVDGRGVRAALALGAGGVQVGTAFLACEESGAREEHRALLFSERAQATTLTRSFSGRLARGLVNRWTREWRARPVAPYPLQGHLTAQLKRALLARRDEARGDEERRGAEPQGEKPRNEVAELSSLWGSQAAPNLRHRRADLVVDELLTGLDDAD